MISRRGFLCDKPWGTSRACTKMYPMGNGQSSRSILLDSDRDHQVVRTAADRTDRSRGSRTEDPARRMLHGCNAERKTTFFTNEEESDILYHDRYTTTDVATTNNATTGNTTTDIYLWRIGRQCGGRQCGGRLCGGRLCGNRQGGRQCGELCSGRQCSNRCTGKEGR